MDDEQIREAIVAQLKYHPKNMERLVSFYRAIEERPNRKMPYYANKVGVPEQSMYPLLRILRLIPLVEKKAYRVIGDTFNWSEYLPLYIRQRLILPDCKYQNLAYYLRSFDEDQMVPGFGKTKHDIISTVADLVIADRDILIQVLSEALAKLAFAVQNISMYNSAKELNGFTVNIDPNNYKELLQ